MKNNSKTQATIVTRSDRLDALTFNRKHGKLLFGSGIGWALDAMDVGMVSFIIAALVQQGFATGGQAGLLASVGFVGMAIGAATGGFIADKIGRRQVFALTLVLYGVATGASALAMSIGVLIALRFFIGLGLGAELPVASTLVSEFSPARIRGRIVVWLEAFWALGWIAAALIGRYVVGAGESGWRWALVIGVLPAFYALYVRLRLPESVRFLESQGRYLEAEAAVREYEVASKDSHANAEPNAGAERDSAEVDELVSAANQVRVSIWSKGLRGRTLALWVVWFCINFSYYGAFIWIPSLLVADGYDLVQSFSFTLIITCAQLPGYAVAAWLIEVLGRRVTLGVFLAGSACAAAGFGLAGSIPMIILAGCLLSFFNLGAWGALYAIGPELYPTSVRGTGSGAAAGFGRIASIIAPSLVPVLIAFGSEQFTSGSIFVFVVFALAFALAAAAAFTLPEQRGKQLVD
jgi:putative MFS transporter